MGHRKAGRHTQVKKGGRWVTIEKHESPERAVEHRDLIRKPDTPAKPPKGGGRRA